MACSFCEGEGALQRHQSHTYGSTYARETYSEPCPDCYEAGICPACGEEDAFVADESAGENEERCKACGWFYDPI